MESLLISNSLSSLQLLPILHPSPHSFVLPPGRRRRLLIHAAAATPPRPLHFPRISLFSSLFRSLQPPKTPTNIGISVLEGACKTVVLAIFVAAVSLLSLPAARLLPAIAATTVSEKAKKDETTTGHEFSGYTRRLLSVVSVLLRRMEDAKSGKGDMDGVKKALKEVKTSRKKIQDEVIGNLNAELKELKSVIGELTKRSEEVLALARAAMNERDMLSESFENEQEMKGRAEELERKIGDLEKEYNDLLVKVEEIEDRMMRRETLTYSIAVRELSFIEKESEVLVRSFGRRMMEVARVSQQWNPSIQLSGKDIQKDLETAQKEYWEQLLLPKVLEAEDPEILVDSSAKGFARNIQQVLKESQQLQRNLEAQIRKELKKYGDEKRFLLKTPETEVLKGFPEVELKWMFGTKDIVVPKSVRVHLYHGWKKWRDEAKANLKKQLLENMDEGQQYIARRRERILLDRERLVAKTWYNDKRKRWEMDPVAVPYAVSKKLIENARIRHDWAVMYISLKGDDKEYFVDIKEFDLLFEDFGGFDGLYTRMISSGIPTAVHLMWIPFSDLGLREQFFLIRTMLSQALTGFWNCAFISFVKKPVFSGVKNITDDLMVTLIFPIMEFIIPKPVRMILGLAWPEEVYHAVESTWFLKWQSEAELNYRARKRDNFNWYFWFIIRSSLCGYVLFHVIKFLKRKLPSFLGYGPLRRDPNLRKLQRLKFYFRYKKNRRIRKRKEGVDPIRSAFDQMKRIRNPPIRLDDFASVESMRDEINDIVTCLQNPAAFKDKGARAPRGVLIVGERGTGKTSLALAIAAEARVPVVEVKASQLEAGLWVGQSASNVRELFEAARDLAPVIIFVEDFDIFAGVRGKFIHTKMQDHEAFINQLLVELDGFENQDGVVLMATTHNLNQIDEALRRPGRMDRVLHLQRPTQLEREKILLLAAKETMDPDLINFVDWRKVAEKTALLRPIELKLVPVALEGSAFRNKVLDPDELMGYCSWFVTFGNFIPAWLRGTKIFKRISKHLADHLGLTLRKEDMQSVVDLMEPYGQISNGIELLSPPTVWTWQEKFPHAVWAAGRGLIAILLPNYDMVDNIWLEPAAWEGIGCTKITKARHEGSLNGNLESRSYLEKKLVFCFGSYVAAQLLLPFGEENFLSSSEIKHAQEIATRMVLQYGWGPDDSPAIYVTSTAVGTLSMGNKHELEMAAKVEQMYNLGYEKAREMLQKNCQVLKIIVEQLLEVENLTGEDLIGIFEENNGAREKEPFTILKHTYKEIALERSLEVNGNAAAVAFLNVA
ncbi:probable inactive ATP-dependent zinc metalloprotease FTSHI 5, chloroplastic [Phalaenopsis equestris]|uniref:probable inactive ATP-dependent zinc metalloprotease FTSHI 5, chloroplastic n=1 Tax=Phalaenopsis equestris TaxID=78828 RepID=UPI0009E4EF16|nr:probable inactive ATP-dependent zinc metalloprotease FTSHI 5, chloroplastic [Phalaenopsis equestris]